jgi:hypothetical protein
MKKLLYIVSVCLIIAGGMGVTTPVSALTVSPARVEITGDPGTTLYSEIELFNEQKGEARTFFTSFENFEPSGDSGAPHFIGAKDGLATWMQTESSVTIASGERTIVPFSITIPANAEPGGHFAAVFFGSQAPGGQGAGEVSIGGKIGVLILLRVSGEVAEGGGLLDFSTKENNRFFSSLPISFVYRVNNTGGNRIVPLGEINVKNTFRLVSAKFSANQNEGSVLPGSARKFEVIWGDENIQAGEQNKNLGFFATALEQLKNFHFGFYTADISLVWGETNQTANSSFSFLVFPWQLLLIIFLVGLTLGFFGKILLKKYNQHIINQAINQQ